MAFCQETYQFLFENRAMDSREWFHAHREQYEELVLEPTRELVEQLTPALERIDPQLVTEPKVGRTISRINRDTRFSKNKELYRDVMWISFTREKYAGMPSFFFEYSPRCLRWGCGWYCTEPETCEAIRDMILKDSPLYLAAEEALAHQRFFRLEDDRRKRTKYPDRPEEKRKWLDQKSFCVLGGTEDTDLLFSPDLPKRLGRDMKKIAPVYQLFLAAREMTR